MNRTNLSTPLTNLSTRLREVGLLQAQIAVEGNRI